MLMQKMLLESFHYTAALREFEYKLKKRVSLMATFGAFLSEGIKAKNEISASKPPYLM